MSNHKTENEMSPELQKKLKNLGFEYEQFEPKVKQRFIAHVPGIPCYVIKGILLPRMLPTMISTNKKWDFMTLELYNPLDKKMEQAAIDLVSKKSIEIKIHILDSTGNVDTTWNIICKPSDINFGNINWSDDGVPHIIHINLNVVSVNISYPKK